MKQYYTIVFADTNEPVRPLDQQVGDCPGMLVYCSKEGTEEAAKDQKERYFTDFFTDDLKVVPLGEERCC